MKFDVDSNKKSQNFDDEIADEPQRMPSKMHAAESYKSFK